MRRMSGIDAAFLYGETPAWHMHVSAVMIGDPSTAPDGFSVEKFKRHHRDRACTSPRSSAGSWSRCPSGSTGPGWIEDPDFDIDAHIRRIGVPPPGRARAARQPHRRPGRRSSSTAASRCGSSGSSTGSRAARSPSWPRSTTRSSTASRAASWPPSSWTSRPTRRPTEPPDEPRAVEHDAQPVRAGRPRRRPHAAARRTAPCASSNQSRAPGPQVHRVPAPATRRPPIPFQAPRTSFNTELTPAPPLRLPERAARRRPRASKDAFGVKLNDVVLALCAGTLRRYLESRDELPDSPLIAQVPVSLRTDDDTSRRRHQGRGDVRVARHRHRRSRSSACWRSTRAPRAPRRCSRR